MLIIQLVTEIWLIKRTLLTVQLSGVVKTVGHPVVESIRTLTSSDFSETSHMLKYDNGGTNTAYFRSEKFLVR